MRRLDDFIRGRPRKGDAHDEIDLCAESHWSCGRFQSAACLVKVRGDWVSVSRASISFVRPRGGEPRRLLTMPSQPSLQALRSHH